MNNVTLRKIFLVITVIFALPTISLPASPEILLQKRTAIELLISKEQYEDACREIRYYLGDSEKVDQNQAVAYAIRKFHMFINLCNAGNREALKWELADWDIADLSRAIVGKLYEISPVKAYEFAKEILTLLYNKEGWQDTLESIIEELYYQADSPNEELYQQLGSLIDQFLPIDNATDALMILRRLGSRCMIIRNVLGTNNFNTLQDAQDYQSDQHLVLFGKKYIAHFFSLEIQMLKPFFFKHHKTMLKLLQDDVNKDDDITEEDNPSILALLSGNKDTFVTIMMNALTGNIASIALSTALLMKKNDAIDYLKQTYNTLLKHEYPSIANGLKEYIMNPPKTEAEEKHFDAYNIKNPRHVNSKDLVAIPDWCKQAFETND